MASQRTKRTIKAPKKYVEAEVEVDEDSPSPKREVLRLVREDEADDLLDKVVYIQWTENDEFHGDWFRARIKKFDAVKKLANIWYTETKEAEKGTDLRNLIAQGTIAFREERSKSHKLRKGEVELPEKIDPEPDEDDDSQYETSDDEGDEQDDSEGGGDEDDGGDDDGGDDDSGEDHGSGKGRKRSRSKKEEDSSSDDEEDMQKGAAGAPGSKKGAEPAAKADDGGKGGPPGSSASNGRGQAAAKRAKVDVSSSRPAAPMPSKRQVTPSSKAQELLAASKDDEDMRAAERASKQLLASILGKKTAGAPTQQFYSGSPAKPQPRQSAPSAPPKLAKSASNAKETEFRDKQRREMKESLTKALEELKAGGFEGVLPDPAMVAERIEATMYKHFGGMNREYGARNRSIQFNLADKTNPDFRAKVLRGDLEPQKLMTMHTQDMASEEKRQWRAQKEEEALKNSVLDTATAARFSTAAALQARGRTGDSAAIDWRTNSLAASPPRNAPADDAADAAAAAAPVQAQGGPSTIKSQPSTGSASGLAAKDSGVKPALNGGSAPPLSAAPAANAHVAFDWNSIKAQALQEASRPMDIPASDVQLSEEHAPVKMEVDQPNGVHHEVKTEGTPRHVKYEHDEGEPEMLDFSPDSFWDVLPDLAPLIASSSGRTPNAWSANIEVPGVQTFAITADYVGGTADISELMGDSEVKIQGRLSLDILANFCEDLRRSRSRTCSVALIRCPSAPEAFKELSDLYEGRQRCGVFQKGQGTEVYLLPGCELSERILKTAIRSAPLDIRSEVPRVVGANEMLLLFVHRRDWKQTERAAAGVAEPKAEPAKASPSSPEAAPEHARATSYDPSAPVGASGPGAGEQAQEVPSNASPAHNGRDPRAPNGGYMQVKQEQPVVPLQAAASTPDQAAAPPAKFALPANLDLSALGKLAAALGVGTVKMPSSAPALAQPVLSQGADPRMAGAVQSSQQPQPMPFPQPGAFPASQLPQPAQWAPNQLPPNHHQQQQPQQQPQQHQQHQQQFMQQPGHFGEPQFVPTDQPGQPFQPQQPAFQAPNQGAPQAGQSFKQQPPSLPRPVTLPPPQPVPITLQPPGPAPQQPRPAPITLRPPQPAGPPAPITLRPPGPITLRPPGPPAAAGRGRGGGAGRGGRAARGGRDGGRGAAAAPEGARSNRPKVMGPGAAAVAGYRPVSPGHSGGETRP